MGRAHAAAVSKCRKHRQLVPSFRSSLEVRIETGIARYSIPARAMLPAGPIPRAPAGSEGEPKGVQNLETGFAASGIPHLSSSGRLLTSVQGLRARHAKAEIRVAVQWLLRGTTGGERCDIVQEIITIVRNIASGVAA